MRPESYRAAIYRGPGSVEVIDLPYPECGDDDVIVRNLACGVCGSDIHAWNHGGDDHLIWKDHEFGHESLSEVIEIGRNVTGLELGDHVFPNQGQALRDMNRMATVGGFSEYIRIPQCELGYSVLRIDNAIPVRQAVLFEPFVIGTRGALSLEPGPGKSAIVFGAGIIGMSAAIMLKWYGCDKVMVVDISDFRLEKAKAFGLVTCNSAREDLKQRAFAEFGTQRGFFGEQCAAELYLDAIGLPVAVENFAMLAGRGARLAVVGVHHAPVPLDLMALCYGNWRIGGCGEIAIEDAFPEVEAMMKSGRFDIDSLVTHEFGVEDIAEALKQGCKPDEAQKVCVAF